MAANANLHKAKDTRNDEFYTQYDDVASEMQYYTDYFKDKVIYCNCDRPELSAFWKYFHVNFNALNLKKLIATYYDPEHTVYKTEYAGGNDSDINAGTKIILAGDGDFMSEECISILKECDVVVTNPAFSLFKELIALLTKYDKKFLLVGNRNAVTCKCVFPLLKDDKIRFGYNNIRQFLQPDGSLKSFGNIGWFTNLNVEKHYELLVLNKHYDPNYYPKYINFDAINVDKISDIPCDYDGIMGVPITYLDKHNPYQFEIVGYNLNECVEELGIKPVGEEWVNLYRSQGGTANITANTHYLVYIKDGIAVSPYRRILIRRR